MTYLLGGVILGSAAATFPLPACGAAVHGNGVTNAEASTSVPHAYDPLEETCRTQGRSSTAGAGVLS